MIYFAILFSLSSHVILFILLFQYYSYHFKFLLFLLILITLDSFLLSKFQFIVLIFLVLLKFSLKYLVLFFFCNKLDFRIIQLCLEFHSKFFSLISLYYIIIFIIFILFHNIEIQTYFCCVSYSYDVYSIFQLYIISSCVLV